MFGYMLLITEVMRAVFEVISVKIKHTDLGFK